MTNLKRVRSFSSDTWIRCVWFDCDRPGYECHKSVFHEHARELSCEDPMSSHINFVFCSERHKQLYRNSHVDLWNLPAGFKSVI